MLERANVFGKDSYRRECAFWASPLSLINKLVKLIRFGHSSYISEAKYLGYCVGAVEIIDFQELEEHD